MKKAICYCFGKNFIEYYDRIIQRYDIVALTDSDSKKWGLIYRGVRCISPEEALKRKAEVILIASDRPEIVDSVKRQMIKRGLTLQIESIMENVNSVFRILDRQGTVDWGDSNDNHVIVEDGCYIKDLSIYFKGDFNKIILKKDVLIREYLNIKVLGNTNEIVIGRGTSVCSLSVYAGEGGKIEIGEDCLLSSDIIIRQTDEHPIFDMTGKRINLGKNIGIGDSVWIGQRATLLGGFHIGNGSIVGYGSVTSSSFGSGCIIGGCPARVIREGVMWKNSLVGLYSISDIGDLRV